jgi:hypothetical protein
VFGSRCVRHWLHRQKAYRALPTSQLWWRKFEPALVASLELRVTHEFGPSLFEQVVPKRMSHWHPLIQEIINAADAVARRQREEHPVRGEEGQR